MNPAVKLAIARLQGLFYAVIGIWPILHMDGFLAVTGPKSDLWLVQMFGALLAGVGCVILLSTTDDRLGLTSKRLGLVVAVVLAGADVLFAAQGRIAPIYLADAAIQLSFVVAWLVTMGADRALRRRAAASSGAFGGQHSAALR
jgi:hypothetical protein